MVETAERIQGARQMDRTHVQSVSVSLCQGLFDRLNQLIPVSQFGQVRIPFSIEASLTDFDVKYG